ncbi:hypothetical protein NM208_g15196 [Fusarium decemcellulare]|uniref:Uncharacterized protein n=1 Tax=Fusarium decemcellulare TaxID=57161 RepID=A0ACC1RFK0_9HYPO|nr:hypothetical protein NM208_g15196 [Fusarium decemcellulare]
MRSTPLLTKWALLLANLPAALSDIVPVETIAALSELYFAKVHPLLPILNEGDYRQSFILGTLPAALAHAVCLLAAKDASAEPHLKLLQAGGTLVSTRQFCSRLHTSIVTSLVTQVSLRRLTTIRIMALLSLHHEGCDGAEQASGYIAQAIHGAQSLALHLRVPNDDGFEMRRAFWCLYVLDRLNAAMHSRPCVMCDHDIATEPVTAQQSGFPAFDILFKIVKILNKVIALYRPTHPDSVTGIGDEFPSFSHILDEGNGWDLAPSIISTLQIFYFATAILGHRLKTITALPTSTPARMRQQLSAIQVIRHMRDPEQLQALHPFPIVVYAASLAVSVSYQQLRYSRLSTDQEQAKHDFNAACQVLQVLRQKWESADVMATLSHRISAELNKVPSLGLLRVSKQDGNGVGRQSVEGHDLVMAGQRQEQQQQQPVYGVFSTLDHSQRHTNTSSLQLEPATEEGGINTLSYTWDIETSQIFDGMDDMAWMYLDLLPTVRDDDLQ